MTAYAYVLQQPEVPIIEKWVWISDTIVSDDGTEQRFSLTPTPKANFSGTYVFSDEASIRRQVATMFGKFANSFDWPAWHNLVVNKNNIAVGDLSVFCNTRRSNFRQGGKFLIVEGDQAEVRTVSSVQPNRIVATVALAKAYTKRAVVVPLRNVYANGQPALRRNAHNGSADASFDYTETLPQDPYIAEADKVPMMMFAGLPILNRRARGNEYTQTLVTGVDVTDYGGAPDIRSPWLMSQWLMPLNFIADRITDYEDWYSWLTFFDYCRGATNPFFVPRYRNDLDVKVAPNVGQSQVRLKGSEYRENLYPKSLYRTIFFHSESGAEHYATVVNCVNDAGDDVVSFDPPLPVGDWSELSIGFLLKCRIADDTVSVSHSGVASTITINVRTVIE